MSRNKYDIKNFWQGWHVNIFFFLIYLAGWELIVFWGFRTHTTWADPAIPFCAAIIFSMLYAVIGTFMLFEAMDEFS